jgi:GT2 family glycosyltransferase
MTTTIVVPTYNRDQTLLNTIGMLLKLPTTADEILVVDQTQQHSEQTDLTLEQWNNSGQIKWIRRSEPSITKAMNVGLSQARNELVLFLDDDIEPRSDIIAVHRHAHEKQPVLWATVGQVIQPWQQPERLQPPRAQTGLRADFDFPFHSSLDHDVQNVMAGNLCVNRVRALSIGGFDENFVGAAFRFETEFARRIGRAGGRIQFLGSAGINHLRVTEGGTRSAGSHLTSASPRHGMGDHYYAFLHGRPIEAWMYSFHRVFREVSTKFHATHPWWIPVKLVGELRAMWAGYALAKRKRREGRRA